MKIGIRCLHKDEAVYYYWPIGECPQCSSRIWKTAGVEKVYVTIWRDDGEKKKANTKG